MNGKASETGYIFQETEFLLLLSAAGIDMLECFPLRMEADRKKQVLALAGLVEDGYLELQETEGRAIPAGRTAEWLDVIRYAHCTVEIIPENGEYPQSLLYLEDDSAVILQTSRMKGRYRTLQMERAQIPGWLLGEALLPEAEFWSEEEASEYYAKDEAAAVELHLLEEATELSPADEEILLELRDRGAYRKLQFIRKNMTLYVREITEDGTFVRPDAERDRESRIAAWLHGEVER